MRCMSNNECRAIEVIGQDWSSEVVTLFLEDWELGRVALSCHMARDVLCQERREGCWDSSESLGFPCSLSSLCWENSLAEGWGGSGAWEVNCYSKRRPSSHR